MDEVRDFMYTYSYLMYEDLCIQLRMISCVCSQSGLHLFLFFLSMASYDQTSHWRVDVLFPNFLLREGRVGSSWGVTCYSVGHVLVTGDATASSLLLHLVALFTITHRHSLCPPSRECGRGSRGPRAALLGHGADFEGSFPLHQISNLDRYVWLSLL